MVWNVVIVDIGCMLFQLDHLGINRHLNLILQSVTFFNGVPFHARVIGTCFVGVDPPGRAFSYYYRDRGDITGSFQPLIQLGYRLSERGILPGCSTIKVGLGFRVVLLGR